MQIMKQALIQDPKESVRYLTPNQKVCVRHLTPNHKVSVRHYLSHTVLENFMKFKS